jgi:hypothetical protein
MFRKAITLACHISAKKTSSKLQMRNVHVRMCKVAVINPKYIAYLLTCLWNCGTYRFIIININLIIGSVFSLIQLISIHHIFLPNIHFNIILPSLPWFSAGLPGYHN